MVQRHYSLSGKNKVLCFTRETPTIIYIIVKGFLSSVNKHTQLRQRIAAASLVYLYNQMSLSRARDGMHGKEEKKRQKRSKRKIMDPKWKTITQFVVVLRHHCRAKT